MSKASSVAYRLRPNKAVDRELFVSLLGRLAAALKIENQRYVGLGGAFLEEFRLLHARTGIVDMVCVETGKASPRNARNSTVQFRPSNANMPVWRIILAEAEFHKNCCAVARLHRPPADAKPDRLFLLSSSKASST